LEVESGVQKGLSGKNLHGADSVHIQHALRTFRGF
jgi:hypothetical protein